MKKDTELQSNTLLEVLEFETNPGAKAIDLHTHTIHSDGALTPTELIHKAREKDLAAVAITDHDSVSGIEEGLKVAKKIGIELIPGVEITSYPNSEKEFHILGYFIDWQNKEFQKTLEEFQILREERAKKVVENLNSLGYQITFGDLRSLAKGTIVQPHIAWTVINDQENKKKLIEDFGQIPSTGDFIVKYLVPGAPAYEPRKTLLPNQAIDLIHKFGGLAILAHPCWSLAKKEGEIFVFEDTYFDDLQKMGLDGIEVYAHRDFEDDTKVCVEHFEKIAEEKGLLMTGGSDYHGFGSAGKDLGFSDFYLKVPLSLLTDLKSRL